jgi:hypothetical protein
MQRLAFQLIHHRFYDLGMAVTDIKNTIAA